MMIKFKIAIIACLVFCMQNVYSQNKTITGKVTDTSNSPLPGVSVLIKGTTNGTETDFDGNFSLSGVNESNELVFSYLGMNSKTVLVGSKTKINVALEESAESLNEVVVIGYGKSSRRNVTGAISSIKSDEITKTPIVSVDQALQGSVSGVTVTNAGSPGSGPQVQIRGLGTFGNSQPLYVIDGVVSGGLNEINPNDIETMDVLKDAATASIYGSRASNGVVMITTKKGKSGKTKFTADTYAAIQSIPKTLDLLNSAQFEKFTNETYGLPSRYTTDPASTKLDTDWQDAVFQSAIMHSTNFSASGGNDTAIFNISAGYLDQEGIIIETGFKRASLRANSEFKLGDRFKVGQTLSIADSHRDNEEQNGDRSLVEHLIKSLPYTPIYNTSNLGGYGGPDSSDGGSDAENAVRLQKLQTNETDALKILGSVYASYDLMEDLTYKFQYGFDRGVNENRIFRPSFNEGINSRPAANIQQGTSIFSSNTFTSSLNYSKTLNDVHNFDVLAVVEKFETTTRNNSSTQDNPLTDEIELVQGEAQVNNQLFEYSLLSYVGRLNYNYDGKYLLSASIRRDGSSRFGANNRWGTFPSVSLGWIISEESFLNNSESINNLKLRGSWGVTGNDGSNDYVFESGLISGYNYNGFANNSGFSNFGSANPDLKWEESTQFNLGLDLAMFDNALSASIEYFNIDTEDLIVPVPNVASDGLAATNTIRNAASSKTNGIELSIGYKHDKGNDFTWSANFNLGTAKSEVTDIGTLASIDSNIFEGENLSRITEGESLFYFYGYETNGLYQSQAEIDAVFTKTGSNLDGNGNQVAQPGDIRFVDQNGDGDIDLDDNVKIGDPFPDFTYGLNLSASYKQFDFSMIFTGVSGNDIYNTTLYDLEGMTRLFNAGTAVLNRWTPTNTNTTIPRYATHSENVNRSDRFIEDGSYTKLRNLTVGYSLNEANLAKVGNGFLTKFRVYISGQNLFTITDYSGYDPEIGGSTVSPNQLSSAGGIGIDRGGYPQPRSILGGIQIAF